MNRNIEQKLMLLLIMLASVQLCWSQQNPILRDTDTGFLYAADPAAEVYNGKVYVYCSHDQPDATDYSSMQDYMVLESEDMINWTNHGVVLKPREYSWADGQMNAPDVAYKDGWYYFYFPYDKTHIGVAKSLNPEGPWEEAVTDKITSIFDPTVFVDDDGQAYIYGSDNKVNIGESGRHIFGAKLKDNMIELDGDWIRLTEETVSEAVHVFKRDSIYYFNARVNSPTLYWMADSPLPQYATYKGELAPDAPNAPNHASAIEFNDQWYFFYQRADVNNGSYNRRSACFEKMYFNEDGTIQPIVYTLDPDYVEKELEIIDGVYYPGETLYFKDVDNLFPSDGSGVILETAGNLGFCADGNYAEFDSVNFPDPAKYLLTINASNKAAVGTLTGELEVYANDSLIGSVEMSGTGKWGTFLDFSDTLTVLKSLEQANLKFLFNVASGQTYIGNLMTAHYELIEGSEYTGLKQHSDMASINVFPTIVESVLSIENKWQTSITYTIYNPQGKNVQQGKLSGNNPEIDVQTLKSGLYVLTLGDNNTSTSFKIIKK